MYEEVDGIVTDDNPAEVDKVTPVLIKRISKETIKQGKNYPEFDPTTDNLKNDPLILFTHITSFFRAVLVPSGLTIF